jgi:hypothetical protein
MSKKTLIGSKIIHLKTSQNWDAKIRPLFTELFLTTIVQAEKTEIQVDPGNKLVTRINVECKALDSRGFVFSINLIFLPKTVEEKNEIVADIKSNDIFTVRGTYNVCIKDLSIIMYSPKYYPLSPVLKESGVRELFEKNSNHFKKIY